MSAEVHLLVKYDEDGKAELTMGYGWPQKVRGFQALGMARNYAKRVINRVVKDNEINQRYAEQRPERYPNGPHLKHVPTIRILTVTIPDEAPAESGMYEDETFNPVVAVKWADE